MVEKTTLFGAGSFGDKTAVIYLRCGEIQVRNEQNELFKRIKYEKYIFNELRSLEEELREKGYQVKIAEEFQEELKEKAKNYLKLSSFIFGGDYVGNTRSKTEGSVKEDETSKKMRIYMDGVKEASKVYEFPLDQVMGVEGEIYSDEKIYSFYEKKLPEIIEKVNSVEEDNFKIMEPPILAIRYKTYFLPEGESEDKIEVPSTFRFELVEKEMWPKWRRKKKIYTRCELQRDFYLVKDKILENYAKRFSKILDVPPDEFKPFIENL